jgi:hypothetical protein
MKKHRGWGSPGMSPTEAMEMVRDFELAENEATARLTSARIWNDGPRCRYFRLIGQGIWTGWPTDEITLCHKQLARDARSSEYKKEKK